MSDIVNVRNPDIIAAEINTIKKEVQRVVIYASIEIGGKLTEAKGIVPQGEWGRWLEKNVEYSQSTAENMMKLYREYGGDQESLFDTWTKSETFAKLTYTQHLALLALPFADRQEFAEKNNAEDLSTRQLQKAVQDQLEEERRQHDLTRESLEAAESRARDAEQNMLDMQNQLATAKTTESAWQEEINKLKVGTQRAEKSEATAQKQVEELKKQLEEAKHREEAIRQDMEKNRSNPEIPDSVMEQLRQEAEAKTAEKAASEIHKQLEAAQEALRVAEQEKEKTREELVAAQKQLKMADPDVKEFTTLLQKHVSDYNALNGLRKKIAIHDPENGEKLLQVQKKIVSMYRDALGVTE